MTTPPSPIDGALLARLSATRLLPVAVVPDAGAAVRLGELLLEAEIPVLEIACRNDAALGALAAVRARWPDLLVGAGTVRSPALADAAVAAGAQFLVAPAFDAETVTAARAARVPMVPGVLTPSEIEAAARFGLRTLKLFPSDTAGGAAYLRTLYGVFPEIRFVPSGGIDDRSLPEILACSNVLAASGSWMTPESLLASGDYAAIRARLAKARAIRAAAA